MNYQKARQYIDEAAAYGSVLGLENIKELLKRLGNPQDDLQVIHVAGTNGKGSFCAFTETILRDAGYSVGRYISPTLFHYRERIQVNGEYIDKDSLAELITKIAEVISEMTAEGLAHPTQFEVETALSFLYFQKVKCDIVILEVGMGGNLDATNVLRHPLMNVITSISMDHMAFLGDTIEEIAACKAGIIKPDTPVVSWKQEPKAMDVIEKVCMKEHSPLTVMDPKTAFDISYGMKEQIFSMEEYKDLVITIPGTYQIGNACLAVAAAKQLRNAGLKITDENIRNGLKNTKWRGRFTVLHEKPTVIMDGAHNRDGARVLAESLKTYFPDRKIHGIMGVFADKEYELIIQQVAPYLTDITAVETPDNPRALPKEDLAKEWKKYLSNVTTAESISEAVEKILKSANTEDVILAFGSLSYLNEIEKTLCR